MSRHRDIRNMDFSDDYEGYNDVYGHSVDDDYYISPSNRQFIYNRENSRESTRISGEQDIQEEEEIEHDLSDVEKAQLESCIDQVKVTLESIDVPRNELVNLIISNKFNVDHTINAILDDAKYRPVAPKEKDVANKPKFSIPKLGINTQNTMVSTANDNSNCSKLNFNIPKPNFTIPKPNFGGNSLKSDNNTKFHIPKLNSISNESNSETDHDYSSLSDLVSSHLNKTPLKEKFLQKDNKLNFHNENTIPALSKSINNIKLSQKDQTFSSKSSPSLSLSSKSFGLNNDWHIDLSKALKPTNSSPVIQKSKFENSQTDFEIPYIEGEEIDDKESIKPVLLIKTDASDILKRPLKYWKQKSTFGRVICKQYKLQLKKIQRIDDFYLMKVKFFDFNTPSPDEVISSHLKR